MASSLYQLKQRSLAKRALEKLFDNGETTIVIHYACESFFKLEDGESPRISCISVKNLGSGHATSFSIHHFAERKGISISDIKSNYNELELDLLADFFDFVRNNQGYTWAHWNMRNINFGFHAIEHRYHVLGGDPVVLPDARKVDISDIMIKLYGVDYSPKPVLANLCQLNDITSEFFLEGREEAEAFERGEFRQIHQSNLKKVDFISYVAEKALTGKLKTQSSWWQAHGMHPRIIIDLIREHWVVGFLALVVLVFAIVRGVYFIAG